MADENNSPIAPPLDFQVEAEPGVEALGPSTPEAQVDTQEAIKKQKQIDQIARVVGRDPAKAGDRIAIETAIAREADQQLTEDEQKIEQDGEKARQKLSSQLDAYKERRDLAARHPEIMKSFKSDPNLEAMVLEEDEMARREQVAQPQDLAQVGQVSIGEAEDAAAPMRAAAAQQEAQQRVEEEQVSKRQMEIDRLMERLDREDTKAIKEIDPQRFWNSKSSGQKVLAGIGVILSGIGAGLQGRGGNSAMDIINKSIQNDINAQKLGHKEGLARKENLHKIIKLKVSELGAQTQNQEKKVRLKLLEGQLAEQQQKARVQRMRADALKNGGEITASMLTKEDIDRVDKLRGEYIKATGDLKTREIMSQFSQIKQFRDNPSAAGDMSMVFSYMKVLDPTSVVREGEFALAEQARGVPESVLNVYNKALKGQRLTIKQRTDFVSQARRILDSKLKVQGNLNRRYEDLSKQFAVPSRLVIEKFDIDDVDPNAKNIQFVMERYKISREKAEQILKRTPGAWRK